MTHSELNLNQYYELYDRKIVLPSERLFVEEFLYPLLGSKIRYIIPQHPFIDMTGRARRIDFAYVEGGARLALEVNGEVYHAEGIIPTNAFDDNLFRQNEIMRLGYHLVRFSYNQLQSPTWRPIVKDALKEVFSNYAPGLLDKFALTPLPIQRDGLKALEFFREKQGWKKGVLVMPTGTGKTILSALDARKCGAPILFLVHRLDILQQSIAAYRSSWPDMKVGQLTGEVKENIDSCDVLFASKDTLRRPEQLSRFRRNHFRYVVVDEVHHGEAPTYREIIQYFRPEFMLGMTATPDRTDRRDIFELFDYNKVFEVSLQEAIEKGYLVPYTYFGLTDDIDYSKIRFENNKYRVDDLERLLIIPKRNAAILKEYVDKGMGDKAIGFCVSIKHADRMATFFQDNGISAVSIHSEVNGREQKIKDFREDKYQIAFTVDLFNEGVDFPNVRVLLFLRPTESKTVFIQQLGRGLRLCSGKDRVRVLDFIGNYVRANQVRQYLSKGSKTTETGEEGKRKRKIEYIYSAGCEVHFDAKVEEILDNQDAKELGVTKEDLRDTYFTLAEKLGRKPGRSDIDKENEYKSSAYIKVYGSWISFLREIGEYTEASFHYPQGTHLGHILSILKVFGSKSRHGTQFDDKYIRLRGNLADGRTGIYQRQVKYKLQAAMELGILPDDRSYGKEEVPLTLTPIGAALYKTLLPALNSLDLRFPKGEDGLPSSRMTQSEEDYNNAIRKRINSSPEARNVILGVFLSMPAVQQMMGFIFQVCRKAEIDREEIYSKFFASPAVQQFCDQEGIEEASDEAAKRRCPFLLNILDACGVIRSERSHIKVEKLLLLPMLVRPHAKEPIERSKLRLKQVAQAWPTDISKFEDEDLSILKELFGPEFLTKKYHIEKLETFEELNA